MANLDSASVTDRSVSLCSTPPGSPGAHEAGSPREVEHFERMQERKRRNRESAERSRKRKFEFYKEIEESVAELKAENERLWRAYGPPSVAAAAAPPAPPPAAPPALALENKRLRARVAELEALLAGSRQQQQAPLQPLQPQPESAAAAALAATSTDLVIKQELDELLKPLPLQPQPESAAAVGLAETGTDLVFKQELLDELLIMDHLVEENEGDDGDLLHVGEDVDDLLVTGAAVSTQPASSLTPISTRWLLAHPSLDSCRSDSDSYTRARTVKPCSKSFRNQVNDSDFVVAAGRAMQRRFPLEEGTSPSGARPHQAPTSLRFITHLTGSVAFTDSSSCASAATARNSSRGKQAQQPPAAQPTTLFSLAVYACVRRRARIWRALAAFSTARSFLVPHAAPRRAARAPKMSSHWPELGR
jgi:hypothetical protein